MLIKRLPIKLILLTNRGLSGWVAVHFRLPAHFLLSLTYPSTDPPLLRRLFCNEGSFHANNMCSGRDPAPFLVSLGCGPARSTPVPLPKNDVFVAHGPVPSQAIQIHNILTPIP